MDGGSSAKCCIMKGKTQKDSRYKEPVAKERRAQTGEVLVREWQGNIVVMEVLRSRLPLLSAACFDLVSCCHGLWDSVADLNPLF